MYKKFEKNITDKIKKLQKFNFYYYYSCNLKEMILIKI